MFQCTIQHCSNVKIPFNITYDKNKLNFAQEDLFQAEMYITSAKKRRKQTIFLL